MAMEFYFNLTYCATGHYFSISQCNLNTEPYQLYSIYENKNTVL